MDEHEYLKKRKTSYVDTNLWIPLNEQINSQYVSTAKKKWQEFCLTNINYRIFILISHSVDTFFMCKKCKIYGITK